MSGIADKPIRVAVVGTGSLGQHHARIYAEMAASGHVQFAGVYDVNAAAARSYAEKFNTRAFTSLEEAADGSDALNVVTPTVTHFAVASELIRRGKHVLIEKPIADDLSRAGELVRLAAEQRVVLQVGHIERFNPVVQFLSAKTIEPRFIEAHRLSPHPGRNTDVGVVLDLMIHDLDIVLALVNAPLVSVDAIGATVLSGVEDIANARLKFANGCVANITASRIHPERVRTIRVFSGGASPGCLSLDYKEQTGRVYRVESERTDGDSRSSSLQGEAITAFGGKRIVREALAVDKAEPLKLELRHFIECVRTGARPLVDGTAATRALELAFQITEQIHSAQPRS